MKTAQTFRPGTVVMQIPEDGSPTKYVIAAPDDEKTANTLKQGICVLVETSDNGKFFVSASETLRFNQEVFDHMTKRYRASVNKLLSESYYNARTAQQALESAKSRFVQMFFAPGTPSPTKEEFQWARRAGIPLQKEWAKHQRWAKRRKDRASRKK